jgi:hypothetical protein
MFHRELIKFKGRENVGKGFLEDLSPVTKTPVRSVKEFLGEKRIGKQFQENLEDKPQNEKLLNYFRDEEYSFYFLLSLLVN